MESPDLRVFVNGQPRHFTELSSGVSLGGMIEALGVKADRVAVEINGEIAPRATWQERHVEQGDRLEIVHFVGGG